MLHGQLHHVLIGTILAAALATSPAGAEAARADDAQVTVVSPGGAQRTLSLAALAGSEDVAERAYTVRSTQGESSQTVSGFSLAAMLSAAGSDPYGFSYLEVQRPAGGSVLLSRHQALDPGAFADGPPVIYPTPAGTAFLRPSSGEDDLNASDCFEAPRGIAIVLHGGSPLRVRAQASATRTRPGRAVSFKAIVERAGAGEQLAYSWYFDDGDSASGASAHHSFAKRGSYDVVVGVTTPGDRAGASAMVTIQVGAPLSGPDRKGGGRRREAAAPDHGAVAGTRGAVPPGPGGGGRVGGAPSDTRPEAALSVRHSTADAPLHKPKREHSAGKPVVGELLSAAAPIGAEKKLAATRSGQLKSGSEGAGVPGAALGLLVVAGLLGLGALTEVRSLLR